MPPQETYYIKQTVSNFKKDSFYVQEDNTYMDIKPVREAFSTAYLAVLEAIKRINSK